MTNNKTQEEKRKGKKCFNYAMSRYNYDNFHTNICPYLNKGHETNRLVKVV